MLTEPDFILCGSSQLFYSRELSACRDRLVSDGISSGECFGNVITFNYDDLLETCTWSITGSSQPLWLVPGIGR